MRTDTDEQIKAQRQRLRNAEQQSGAAVEAQRSAQTSFDHAAAALDNTRAQLTQTGTAITSVEQQLTDLRQQLQHLERLEPEQQEAAATARQRLQSARQRLPAAQPGTQAGGAEQPRPSSAGETSAAAHPAPPMSEQQATTTAERPATPTAETPAAPTEERPVTPRTALRESEQQHEAAKHALEGTQQKKAELEKAVSAASSELASLRQQHGDLTATEKTQSESVRSAEETLAKAKSAVTSAAATQQQEQRRLDEVTAQASQRIEAANRQHQEALERVQRYVGDLHTAREELHRAQNASTAWLGLHGQANEDKQRWQTRVNEYESELRHIEDSLRALRPASPPTPGTPQGRIVESHPVFRRARSGLPRVESAPALSELGLRAPDPGLAGPGGPRTATDRREMERSVLLPEFTLTSPTRPSSPARTKGAVHTEDDVILGETSSRVRGRQPTVPEGVEPVHGESLERIDTRRLSPSRAGLAPSSPDRSVDGSLLDVPHSGHVDLETLDGEAFALRDGVLYVHDSATDTFNAELENVRQLKLGANGHAYARHAEGQIFALTEARGQSNGIAARELPLPKGGHLVDFTVSPAGSVAYIGQQRPTDAAQAPPRTMYWLTHGSDTPRELPAPATMGQPAAMTCSPNGQLYVLDQNGEMWRGRPDDVLAHQKGEPGAVGWRRLDVPHPVVKCNEITTLPTGNIQASTNAREDWPPGTPGVGPDNRLHYVLSLKDEWLPHEQMAGNVLDLAYRDKLKNQSANRKGGVTLGIGAGKRSGWDHEEHPSLVVRGARQASAYVSDHVSNAMSRIPAPVIRAAGDVALGIAAATIFPAGRAAWLARPVVSLVPTMVRNRKIFHASPPPVQLPGLEQRPAAPRGSRWINFVRGAYNTHTERGARNAALRRELAIGTRLIQGENPGIPAPPASGVRDEYAVIRSEMVNKLVVNAETALNRIEKELGTIDANNQPVAANLYQNNELYKRYRLEPPGRIKTAVRAGARLNDSNNVLYHLHRQADALLQHTGSPQAQALVDRLRDLMQVKQLYIPADELAGMKDVTGWGARDTAHAFFTTQLSKIASDLGHTFKAVQAVQQRLAAETPVGDAARSRTAEIIESMSREAAARMDAPGAGRVNTDFHRYDNLSDYATSTDPAVIEKQLVRELGALRALPDDNRLSALDAPELATLKQAYHDGTKKAIEQLYDALGLEGVYTEFQTKGRVPNTSTGAPYRQLQQRDDQLVWSSQNALFELYKRRMVTLHGVPADEVQAPAPTPAEHARGDIPLTEKITVHEPLADGELTARIEFLLRQGIFLPVSGQEVAPTAPDGTGMSAVKRGKQKESTATAPPAPTPNGAAPTGTLSGKAKDLWKQVNTKTVRPNAGPLPEVRGLRQRGPTPAAKKAPHPDVHAPTGMLDKAKSLLSRLRPLVIDTGADVLLGQLVRCQLVAEEAAQEVAQKSKAAAQTKASKSQTGKSTGPAVQDDTIESAPREGALPAALPSEELKDVATRSQARMAGSRENPAGALFEKGLVSAKIERVAEKLRIQQMTMTHPDHPVTRAINMQGTIHPEDVEAFARMAWRSMPTGTTIRLDHTLHLGIDFDGLGFSFRFVNRQEQGVPEVPGTDSSKNVLNIPLNSLFSFQPTPYIGRTAGSSVSLTKTTDGADISMSNFTDHELKLLAGKLMWGAGRFGANEVRASDGSMSHTALALIYWGFELIPNLLKVSGRGTDQLTFHVKNDESGLAESAAVNILDRKASLDHLLEVCASIVESHKDTTSREHEVGFHPLAASVFIGNRADDKNVRGKAVAAGLIQAALTGNYSSEVEVREGEGKVRTTTTAKRKSTTVVLKPIEVTELQFSKQWPWRSPVPIKGIQPQVGDGVEMEHKVPTWIRVGIINVFQKNGLAAGVTMSPNGKVEGVSWGATTRHEFKSFPQLEQLRQRSPIAYKNMMRLAQEAERENTPINVNLELTPDALDRLNRSTNEADATRILKDQNSYRIKSVSAGEEYRYETGTFFGFDFFRMDKKASNTFSNPARGLVEVKYPQNDEEAVEVKVRGPFTIGGGKADFAKLDARRQNVEVENAILDVGISKERVLLAMVSASPANGATVRAAANAMRDTSRSDARQDHIAMHNGRVVLRTWTEGQWRQAALSAQQLNALLSTPPRAPDRTPTRDGSQTALEGTPSRGSDRQGRADGSDRSVNLSVARSQEVAQEWRDEFNAEKEELKQSGAVSWAQNVLRAMSAGENLPFGHDPQVLLGAEAVNALKQAAAHDARPANVTLNPGRPVYVGEIIREMDEARARSAAYPLDPAQEHVLATYFPAADGSLNRDLLNSVLATDPYGFIRAADLIAGRVKPALLARIDIPEVAGAAAARGPAPVPGVPVVGGISAGGA